MSQKKPLTPRQAALVERLRAVQAELGKSDAAMGKLVGVGRTRWNNWVTGGNMPEEESMIRLCDEAEVTLDWLYRGRLGRMPAQLAIRLELRLAGIDPDAATPEDRGRAAERVLLADA